MRPFPFRFDGHGINDADGQRLAKVVLSQWAPGAMERNPEFDQLSKLLAAAPELLDALEELYASYKQLVDSGDAGLWTLEDQPEGIKALAVIKKVKGDPA